MTEQKQKIVCADYWFGYAEGIRAVIRILKGTDNGPFSKEAKENFIMLGELVEEQMTEMVKQAMVRIRKDT